MLLIFLGRYSWYRRYVAGLCYAAGLRYEADLRDATGSVQVTQLSYAMLHYAAGLLYELVSVHKPPFPYFRSSSFSLLHYSIVGPRARQVALFFSQ